MNGYIDFGSALRSQRVRRGMTLDDVARTTKIPPTLLDALEEGQSERFPERVFVLNYVRSYAVAVGLPAEETVAQFQSLPDAPKAEAFDPVELELVRRARAITMLWVSIALALLLVVAFVLETSWELALHYVIR